ncbi:MAG: hypothetical protein ABSA05_07645 [Opitutaceae bacterium]|jgi:hypothetical protein
MNRDSYELKGLAMAGTATFAPETRGNPLEAFSSLCIRGRPFNLWLTAEFLEPQLERWSVGKRSRSELSESVAADVEEATKGTCMAFHEIANSVPAPNDQGLLAATGVAANLQRTLALIGEFMLGDPIEAESMFSLSRYWCGLVDYSRCQGYFSMCVEEATAPGPLRADRRDYGHIRNALRCSIREIEPRCADGLRVLGDHVRRSGLFQCEDLRHLLSSSIPRREAAEPYRNRSGVVRPRNSSM